MGSLKFRNCFYSDHCLGHVILRVVFVIETREGDTKSGKSKGRKSPSVVQGQSPGIFAPVGDWGTKSPEAEAFC